MTEIQKQNKETRRQDVSTPEEKMNANLTISSKLSTDQLVCKSPPDSPSSSIKSLKKIVIKQDDDPLMCLGLLQFVFGFLMVVFGGLVLHYDASLSRLGGGIWAGCLAMGTGIMGILASAKDWCPLKSTPQKITHTIFLALSLVSLAIAQLVVALAATGVARDFSNSKYEDEEVQTTTAQTPSGKVSITLPMNYLSILSNLGLLAVSTGEFVAAAVASYKSSRVLCPCFRRKDDYVQNISNRNALVSSWLGKHSPPPQLYVVTPSTLGKGSKLSGGLSVTPVFALPPQMVPPPHGYPLIPAPLGTIPSPIIPPPSHRDQLRKKKKHFYTRCTPREVPSKKSRAKSKEKTLTEQDVVRTYTGLDKTIAEEFIDICDSRNVSLCSDSSCSSSCRGSCKGCNSNSDGASREYLVAKTT